MTTAESTVAGGLLEFADKLTARAAATPDQDERLFCRSVIIRLMDTVLAILDGQLAEIHNDQDN